MILQCNDLGNYCHLRAPNAGVCLWVGAWDWMHLPLWSSQADGLIFAWGLFLFNTHMYFFCPFSLQFWEAAGGQARLWMHHFGAIRNDCGGYRCCSLFFFFSNLFSLFSLPLSSPHFYPSVPPVLPFDISPFFHLYLMFACFLLYCSLTSFSFIGLLFYFPPVSWQGC